MTDQTNAKRPHFVLKETARSYDFTAHSRGGEKRGKIPQVDRKQHGEALKGQLDVLKPLAAASAQSQSDLGLESGLGLQIQFVGRPEVELAFESLANDPKKIELLSLRQDSNSTVANIFVPDGKLAHFEQYVTDYLQEKMTAAGQARDHRNLLETIAEIRAAELKSLWTDDAQLLPENAAVAFWWEVWLPVRGKRQLVVDDFRKLALASGCTVSAAQFNFPERTVLLMYGSRQQLSSSVLTLNCVAELRRAKDTAEFFQGMAVDEQQQWVNDMLNHLQAPAMHAEVPYVCLLDSGVNRAHPLLDPLLAEDDTHAVVDAWGKADTANHGTGLAGLVVYGDLTEALAVNAPIRLSYRLESVRLTPSDGANQGDAKHHAYLFETGVTRPEIAAPDRSRVFTSAVTASDYRDRGRPSSWSSAVDSLAADSIGGGKFHRLFILCAGNIKDPNAWGEYPASLSTNLIHDPGQAWNAITVGACTHKVDTDDHASLTAIAGEGCLSPFTTTSRTWDSAWPLKPDVVFEGGNAAHDELGPVGMDCLNLLTTHNNHLERLFTTTNATSAASALCARMAAQIMAAYPNLRPETVRALIVHSGEWTDGMRSMYLPQNGHPTKTQYVDLIRHCGWGKPDLDRALWSVSDSLTLVIEDSLHPYRRVKDRGVVTRDMNLHSLPWPKEELEQLGDMQVEMRVTLSYYIHPNPSARGAYSKYHYPSHRLRFDVQRPLDGSTEDFVARVNAAALREDEGDIPNPKDPEWYLGERQRHRGSLHQDVWSGTAAELGSRGFIAVYPAMGWWRTRPALEQYDLPARYSLVVSIRTQQADVDLYTAVQQRIGVETAIAI